MARSPGEDSDLELCFPLTINPLVGVLNQTPELSVVPSVLRVSEPLSGGPKNVHFSQGSR